MSRSFLSGPLRPGNINKMLIAALVVMMSGCTGFHHGINPKASADMVTAMQERDRAVEAVSRAIIQYCSLQKDVDARRRCLAEKQASLDLVMRTTPLPNHSASEDPERTNPAVIVCAAAHRGETQCTRRRRIDMPLF